MISYDNKKKQATAQSILFSKNVRQKLLPLICTNWIQPIDQNVGKTLQSKVQHLYRSLKMKLHEDILNEKEIKKIIKKKIKEVFNYCNTKKNKKNFFWVKFKKTNTN